MTGHSNRVPEFVVVGHFTIDRTPQGDQLGGSVLYSALTAARYGLRTTALTAGNIDALSPELREQFAAFSAEFELVIQAAPSTTSMTNEDVSGRRQQTLHSWAGMIDLNGMPPLWRGAQAIHVAPVADEIDVRQLNIVAPRLLCCTPQGWMRTWDPERFGPIRHKPLRFSADTVSRFNAAVISSEEFVEARDFIHSVGQRGLAVVTQSIRGAYLIDRGREVQVPAYRATAVDTVGAGDVFASALFANRADGQSVAASARYAAAASALSIGKRGIDSAPHRHAVEHLMETGKPRA